MDSPPEENAKGEAADGSDTAENSDERSKESLDINLLKRRSLQKCTLKFVADMEPEEVLDVFADENLFNPVTKMVIRDIRELDNTSNKNRAIVSKIETNPHRYGNFKEALARTGQAHLVESLQDAEVAVHDEMKSQQFRCSCQTSLDCGLLKEIRCPDGLAPHISKHIKDLQKYLIELYLDQCTRVPLYPLEPDKQEKVDRLFVRPEMVNVTSSKQNIVNSGRIDNDSVKDTVRSYKEIFYDGNRRCRNVYVTGEAGVGKTTLCESIVLTWCNAHLKKHTNEDEETIAEFSLLFYIALRNCTENETIEQMIENQLEIENVSSILERERCLVILDGLDEWESNDSDQRSRFVSKGLPGRKLRGNFTILTTTRPWKMEILRLKTTEVDRQISINGFSSESLRALEKGVLNILNETYSQEKKVDDFHKQIGKSKLKDLTQTPLMLMQLLCLWHGNVDLGDSQCEIYSSMIDRQLEHAEQVKRVAQGEVSDSTSSHVLPNCLEDKALCKKYRDVLSALSYLAYQLLCNQSKEASLVFSHKQTEVYGMTEKQLQFCLKVGLLTQHKTVGKVTEKLKCISFLHKTYQEFFVASFITAQHSWTEKKELLSKIIFTLDSFLEMSKICVFVCGMKPETAGPLFDYIAEVIGDDNRIQRYRTYWYDTESDFLQLAKRIQEVAFEVLKEVKNTENDEPFLKIDDLIIRKDNAADFLTFGNKIDTTRVKSIYLNSRTLVSSLAECVQAMHSISAFVKLSSSLTKMCIIDSRGYISTETMCTSCVAAKDTLKCVSLISVNITDLGVKFASMFEARLLVSLVLREISLTHQQIEVLIRELQMLSCLKQLNLSNMHCDTHSEGDCSYVLDLSSLNLLEQLFMYHLNAIDVILDQTNLVECTFISMPRTNFLRQLKTATNVDAFICLGFQYPVCAEALVDILPNLQNARSIDIRTVDFGDMSLRLSPEMSNLEIISLSDVTITDTGLKHFVDSLPNNGVQVHIHLTIKPTEGVVTNTFRDFIKESPGLVVTRDFEDPWNSSRLFMEFYSIETESSSDKVNDT